MKLKVESLAAIRGERVVFRNVSFELASGEALTVHGANGSGKTTLLRVIARLLSPMAGRHTFTDDNGKALQDEMRDRLVHYVGHQDSIRPQLRVAEALRFHASLLAASTAGVQEALALWGLLPLAELSAGFLSAGQRRRLTLSRLSLQQRKLWLLDEPTVALDERARNTLTDCCTAHLKTGGMIIAAAHETFLGDAKTLSLGVRA